jgi:AcrR family transcriptional regulator
MPRPDQSQRRRSELLPILARSFAEKGYRRVTTAELARRCAVRENILYRLWPDKKAMFIAAIGYVYELSAAIWGRLLIESVSLDGSAARLLDYEACHHGEFLHYRVIFAGLGESDDPQIRRALRRMYGQFHNFVRLQVEGFRRGLTEPKAPDAALCAWGIIGLGTVANISRELGLLGEQDRRKLIREVGRLLLAGKKP